MAPLFAILIVNLIFTVSSTPHKLAAHHNLSIPPKPATSHRNHLPDAPTKHTCQSPPTTNSTHINLTMRTMMAAQTSTRQGLQEQASMWPCCRCRRLTGSGSPKSKEWSTAGRLRGGRGIAVAAAAALAPQAHPWTRGAQAGAALTTLDWGGQLRGQRERDGKGGEEDNRGEAAETLLI